jgi:hypothetical protein
MEKVMIKRHALIIGCPNVNGQEKLPGAQIDVDAWKNFLLSNHGGGWYHNEITVLTNPTPQEVHSKIKDMPDGYSFITFSGHGYVDSSSSTMICLQGGNVSELDLVPSSARTTVILDSCRGLLQVKALKESLEMLRHEVAVDREKFRDRFDIALEHAEKGICRIYGCAFEQAAQESKAGGDFTQALVLTGVNWSGPGVLSLRAAFDTAEKVVRSKKSQQTPECQLGRRIHHFPFAVYD